MAEYPIEWEADVVLSNGRPVHLRPITPGDVERLQEFHQSLSPETIYFRFFTTKPSLSDRELHHFTHVDYVDRVAFVAIVNDEIIGVGRYDRVNESDAEIAFNIRDEYQGRGLGSVFLEHLAAAARDRGISRFVAEVLPENRKMINTFKEAGYTIAQRYEDHVLAISFAVASTEQSRAVSLAREHRAEARSVQLLMTPTSVAVIGASDRPNNVGRQLVGNLIQGGYKGQIIPVHPTSPSVLGLECRTTLRDVGHVDLAIVAVPARQVAAAVADAALAGISGLIVVSRGFGDGGADGKRLQANLLAFCRAHGIRLVGPNALGLINTDPNASMNASLAPSMPSDGSIGFFSQSGALGGSILSRLEQRGLGLSAFVSAGNRADVSGNDLLQYWESDERTRTILLYLESFGNPRKFARLVRRISATKPVLMVQIGGAGLNLPSGHRAERTRLSQHAIDDILQASGPIVLDSIDEMLNLAGVLGSQPLPAGTGIAVVGNSEALMVLAGNAAHRIGCDLAAGPITLPTVQDPEGYRSAVRTVLEEDRVDALLLIHTPGTSGSRDREIREMMLEEGRAVAKPVLAVMQDSNSSFRIADGVPTFLDVEHAISALGSLQSFEHWRETLADDPEPPQSVDVGAIEAIIASALQRGEQHLSDRDARALLAAAGLPLQAIPAAGLVGRGCTLTLVVDPQFGPVCGVGVADPIASVLDDIVYRLAPMHPNHAADAVASMRAFPLVGGEQLSSAYTDYLYHLSWLPEWAPEISLVSLADLRFVGDQRSASVSITLDPNPQVFDPRMRRMAG
ncbi:MAG: GNAT family N-acetyltransferase [Actinomycetota bacterium]|nr:GNAT family N-acetyltransferase [Actinomycetota bacterium]